MTIQPELSKEPKPSPPLEALAEQFSNWRASRSNRRSPVPEGLRRQVLESLKNHRKSHVIKALGINSQMLKNWQTQEASSPPLPTFVSLKADTAPIIPEFELALLYSQGGQVTVKGDFSLAQITAFAQGLRPGQVDKS